MVSISLWFAFNLYLWNIGNNTNNINANWCTLWFAFNLYLWNIGNNIEPFNLPRWSVVICFQFVSLKYWQQLPIAIPLLKLGCDLLSICIFEILATTSLKNKKSLWGLWFAFNLYLWNIGNNNVNFFGFSYLVVICFQFVSLKYWQQHANNIKSGSNSCDLLSICIFEILATTAKQR